jgi:hypothetical protein
MLVVLDSRFRGNDGVDSRFRGNDGVDSRFRGNDGDMPVTCNLSPVT